MTTRVASYVAEAAEAALDQAADEIGTAKAAAIAADATALLRAPATLTTRLAAAIADVRDIGRVEWLAGNALALPAVPDTTAQRKIQKANQAALQRLVRDLAAIELAARLPARPFASRTGLRGAHGVADALLEAAREDAGDDVHRAVGALKAALVEHVRQQSAKLPAVTTAVPATVLPALVLAHDFHEDIDRDGEIAERNAAARPGFVPARPLEVLQ